MPDKAAVETRRLNKSFGQTAALTDLDLRVSEGELFAVVGPDGAGKTTLLQILSGVMPATSGSAFVSGKPARQASIDIGYLTQHSSIYSELSIDENLRYSAGLRDVQKAEFTERRERYLKEVGLLRFSDRLAGQLSGGMRQKLALCCALISAPKILLLDEPTTGLDPLSRREFWHMLASLTDAGTTTIVATPQFDEAELCQRVALLASGRVQQTGAPFELREAMNVSRLEVLTEDPGAAERALVAALATGSEESLLSPSAHAIQCLGDRVDLLVKNGNSARATIESILKDRLRAPFTVLIEQPKLENVFLSKLELEGKVEFETEPFPWSGTGSPGAIQAASQNGAGHAGKTTKAISASRLTRRFNDFCAVKEIDLAISYGEIYGLLGANGAGKTTTMRMLCGLLSPTAGELSLAGTAGSSKEISKLRQSFGYMSQKFTLYDDLTVSENLQFYASAYSLKGSDRKAKIDWVVNVCRLEPVLATLVGKLPRGFKQRIAFASAVMHEPEILFLDEPTAGVDPLVRRQIWRIIRDLSAHGTAVVVTTHFLEDAEYCNRVGLMVDGELVAEGIPGQIKRQSGKVIEISTRQVFEAFDKLSGQCDPALLSVFPGRLHVQLDENIVTADRLAAIVSEEKIEIAGMRAIPSSLEDAFVTIVRKRKRR